MIKNIKEANEQLMKEKEGKGVKVEEAVREAENQKLYLSASVNRILFVIEKFAGFNKTI